MHISIEKTILGYQIEALIGTIEALRRRRDQLDRRRTELNELGMLCHHMVLVEGSVEDLRTLHFAAFFIGSTSAESYQNLLTTQSDSLVFLLQDDGENVLVAILTSRRLAPNIQKRLLSFRRNWTVS